MSTITKVRINGEIYPVQQNGYDEDVAIAVGEHEFNTVALKTLDKLGIEWQDATNFKNGYYLANNNDVWFFKDDKGKWLEYGEWSEYDSSHFEFTKIEPWS